MGAKKKLGSTAREKPLISAGVSVFACFLSGFTLNFLCGLPILGSLQATTTLYLIAVLWMLMNFIIPDIFDKIFNFPPVLIVLVAGKELLRNKKIYGSIDKALKIYPERHGSKIKPDGINKDFELWAQSKFPHCRLPRFSRMCCGWRFDALSDGDSEQVLYWKSKARAGNEILRDFCNFPHMRYDGNPLFRMATEPRWSLLYPVLRCCANSGNLFGR